MATSRQAYLLVPALERGRGSGHLKRQAALASHLKNEGHEAYIFADTPPVSRLVKRRNGASLWRAYADEIELEALFRGNPASRAWDLIVLDRFRCPYAEYRYWRSLAPVLALDEGGRARYQADYLIDLLPRPQGWNKANRTDPRLIVNGVDRRSSFFASVVNSRVLVSFGGEDRAGLTEKVRDVLEKQNKLNVDIILPAVSKPKLDRHAQTKERAGRALILPRLHNLNKLIAKYDLVITQFGLSAFEALWARVPVILVSPTAYHERLSRYAGFASAGGKRTLARRLPVLLSQLARVAELSERVAARYFKPDVSATEKDEAKTSLAQLIATLSLDNGRCPLCASSSRSRRFKPPRFADRSFFRCADCGLIYQVRAIPHGIRYSERYFLQEYASQYGKSYIEDFPHLEAMAKRRLSLAASLSRRKINRYLDIGCAYGPSLSAACHLGWEANGLDLSEAAIRYIRENLGLKAELGAFPNVDPLCLFNVNDFDLISLWYVIEHFDDLNAVFRQLNRCLPLGGVLAMATPSASGVSGRFNRHAFYKNSPADHRSVWEPAKARKLLARYGFSLRRVVVTGHHPERFPFSPSSLIKRYKALGQAFAAISRLFGLGDTFELYAVKTRDLCASGEQYR